MRYYCKLFFSTLAVFAFIGQQLNAQKKAGENVISVASELKSYFSIADLPAYREASYTGQVSSYDRTGGNDDGFSGKYSYVRKLRDSSLVLFDRQGPGIINRIWTPTPSADSLDFYIDDTTKPAFSILYTDLFSGKVAPFVSPLSGNQLGGYFNYLPIPFQKRCMIVFRGKQTMFYQIGYRTLPHDARVKSFSLNLDSEDKSALQKVQELWNKREKKVQDFISTGSSGSLQTFPSSFQLKPGETKTLMQISNGGRIVGIELEPASTFESMTKDIDIKITWDKEAHPAVYVPVADFFGYAYGKMSMQSLLIGSMQNKAYSYFPMPFDRSAKIELVYRKPAAATAAKPLNVVARIYFVPQVRSAAKEGKFYANWNHKAQVPIGKPHVFLNTLGKGHYVGTVLQAKGLEPGMTGFFEGDDSTVVDGKLLMHGTGSEDYFNGGWYAMMDRWDDALSLPLSGSLDYSLPLSRTGGYRLFLADKMPFEKSFHHVIEHGPEGNLAPVSYTSVAYYYSNTPQVTTIVPRSEDTRVLMPDTLFFFPQLLTLNLSGNITIHRLWQYPTGGENIIFTTNGEAGARVHLEDVPSGDYQVYLDYAKHPQGGSFSLWQRQTPLTNWMSAYSADTARIAQQYFGNITLTPLNGTITLRFKGDGNRNQFFLNRIILIRKAQP